MTISEILNFLIDSSSSPLEDSEYGMIENIMLVGRWLKEPGLYQTPRLCLLCSFLLSSDVNLKICKPYHFALKLTWNKKLFAERRQTGPTDEFQTIYRD